MLDAPSALALASSSMGAFAGLSIQTENRRVCPGGLINIRTLKSQLESAQELAFKSGKTCAYGLAGKSSASSKLSSSATTRTRKAAAAKTAMYNNALVPASASLSTTSEGERTDAAEAEIGATARLRALSAAKAELIGFIVWLS